MINEEKMTLTIPNEFGIQTEYIILFSFVSSKTNKHYIVYTDNTLDEDGNLKVLSSVLNVEDETITPIETDEEYKLVQEKVDLYQQELKKED